MRHHLASLVALFLLVSFGLDTPAADAPKILPIGATARPFPSHLP